MVIFDMAIFLLPDQFQFQLTSNKKHDVRPEVQHYRITSLDIEVKVDLELKLIVISR